MKLENNHLVLETAPKRPKKVTGTRFASVLGLNPWATPFTAWCAMTKTYEEPFVDTIYTQAGKIAEPKIIKYLNDYYFGGQVFSPSEVYGPDYEKTTRRDFFPGSKIFGGMWDALVMEDGKPTAVIEIKTTKRVEDWTQGTAPIYYALQGCLYAYLLGVEDVYLVGCFLDESDYGHMDTWEPNSSNCLVDAMRIHARFPKFSEYIEEAKAFYEDRVLAGVSPEINPTKDKPILDILQTKIISAEDTTEELIDRATRLTREISALQAKAKPLNDELTRIKDALKETLSKAIGDYTKLEVAGTSGTARLSKRKVQSLDTERMKEVGINVDSFKTINYTYEIKIIPNEGEENK